jgi:hypothetical protein
MYNTFYRVRKQNTVKQRHYAPEDWAERVPHAREMMVRMSGTATD